MDDYSGKILVYASGMELALLIVFAVWPLVGVTVLRSVNAFRRKGGRPAPIPPAVSGTDVLAHMYLWPVVLYKSLRLR